jgi:hypothetical protein
MIRKLTIGSYFSRNHLQRINNLSAVEGNALLTHAETDS